MSLPQSLNFAQRCTRWMLAAGMLGMGVASAVADDESTDLNQALKSVQRRDATSRNTIRLKDSPVVDEQPSDQQQSGARSGIRVQVRPTIESRTPDDAPIGTPGERELIRERYSNRRVKIEREVTQDERGNYLNDGSWQMWDESGNLVARGQYKHGKRDGVWLRWHRRNESKLLQSVPYNQFEEPFVSQAEFRDGELHGPWSIFDAKQRKISEWNFEDGQRQGISTWWYANGKKMREVQYEQGHRHGELMAWNVRSELVTRENYQHGRKLAPKTEYYNGGNKKTEGIYLHARIVLKEPDNWWQAEPALFTTVGEDERHGKFMAWYPNGQTRVEGRYEHDVEVGQFTWWYSNGQKATAGTFVQGLPDGVWTWWHENGQKATEGEYRQGQQVGQWMVWNPNGRVVQAAEHAADSKAPQEETDPSDSNLEAVLPRLSIER